MTARRAERLMRGAFHRRAFLVAMTLLLAIATPALAEDGATYGARPAPGDGDRSSGTFNLSVGRGSSRSDAVEVLNFTDEPAAFDVYVAGVVPTSGGGLAPAARDAEITGAATWVRVNQATVEVPTRSAATVPFTISVPEDTPLGSHTVALLVEPQDSTDAGGVASRTRIGLWIKLEVTLSGEGRGGVATLWGFPWIFIIPAGLALVAWLAYVNRRDLQRWMQNRREERAVLRDLRSRRRRAATAAHHR